MIGCLGFRFLSHPLSLAQPALLPRPACAACPPPSLPVPQVRALRPKCVSCAGSRSAAGTRSAPCRRPQSAPLSVPSNLTYEIDGDAMKPFLLPLNRVIEVTINNMDNGEHPFHLHGHYFWVVATSDAPDSAKCAHAHLKP